MNLPRKRKKKKTKKKQRTKNEKWKENKKTEKERNKQTGLMKDLNNIWRSVFLCWTIILQPF